MHSQPNPAAAKAPQPKPDIQGAAIPQTATSTDQKGAAMAATTPGAGTAACAAVSPSSNPGTPPPSPATSQKRDRDAAIAKAGYTPIYFAFSDASLEYSPRVYLERMSRENAAQHSTYKAQEEGFNRILPNSIDIKASIGCKWLCRKDADKTLHVASYDWKTKAVTFQPLEGNTFIFTITLRGQMLELRLADPDESSINRHRAMVMKEEHRLAAAGDNFGLRDGKLVWNNKTGSYSTSLLGTAQALSQVLNIPTDELLRNFAGSKFYHYVLIEKHDKSRVLIPKLFFEEKFSEALYRSRLNNAGVGTQYTVIHDGCMIETTVLDQHEQVYKLSGFGDLTESTAQLITAQLAKDGFVTTADGILTAHQQRKAEEALAAEKAAKEAAAATAAAKSPDSAATQSSADSKESTSPLNGPLLSPNAGAAPMVALPTTPSPAVHLGDAKKHFTYLHQDANANAAGAATPASGTPVSTSKTATAGVEGEDVLVELSNSATSTPALSLRSFDAKGMMAVAKAASHIGSHTPSPHVTKGRFPHRKSSVDLTGGSGSGSGSASGSANGSPQQFDVFRQFRTTSFRDNGATLFAAGRGIRLPHTILPTSADRAETAAAFLAATPPVDAVVEPNAAEKPAAGAAAATPQLGK